MSIDNEILLYKGGQSSVYLFEKSNSGQKYVKKIFLDDACCYKEINIYRHLLTITDLQGLIPKIYSYRLYRYQPYIIFNHIDGIMLDEVYDNNLPINIKLQIILKLANIVKILHDNNITHGDIKPENILIDNNYNVYLLDFAMSDKISDIKNKSLTLSGTIYYVSPEMIGKYYLSCPEKRDIWALGVILYELLNNGNSPFYNEIDSTVFTNICQLKYEKMNDQNYNNLFASIFQLEPLKRINIDTLITEINKLIE